jgi:protein required for attachment to host cells
MPRIRIVVADRAHALFYESHALKQVPRQVGRIENPEGRKKMREIASDRPGRTYESYGTTRHAHEVMHSTRKESTLRFARRIASRLDRERRRGDFDRLILAAPPRFFGTLREALSGPTLDLVTAELQKDLVREPPERIPKQLGW